MCFQGRHDQLVEETSLEVDRGELLLVVADTQLERTAIALMLSGRMSPSAGTVTWSGARQIKELRTHSALIDSPEVNEPEAHLKVRDVASEDLSLVPGPFWRRPHSKKWLAKHGFDHLAGSWIDTIDPLVRIKILTQLALENHSTDCLVFDSPDRHGIAEPTWLETLEELTLTRRQLAVIAVVSRVPDSWEGPVAFVGQTNTFEESPPLTEAVPWVGVDPLVLEVDEDHGQAQETALNESAQITGVKSISSPETTESEAAAASAAATSETLEEPAPPVPDGSIEPDPVPQPAPEAASHDEAELPAKPSTIKD